MTYPVLQRELTVHLNNGHWYLRPTEDPAILGPVDFGWHRCRLYPDSFTFGEGLLAGSSIPGTRRLIFCAWSPQWESFYIFFLALNLKRYLIFSLPPPLGYLPFE